MLTFRNTNIFFASLLIFLIAINFHAHISVWLYIISVFIYSLVLFYGSYFIEAGFYIRSVCSAKINKKAIAITFDDGPSEKFTSKILEVLKENNVQASFFCIGNRIKENENLLKKIHHEGHIIGNHSYSHHFWFDLFSAKKMLDDMQSTDIEVKKNIGLSPKLFRPPYGVTNPNVKKAILKGEYSSVGWNVRSMDTVAKDKNKLLQKLKTSIKPGAIILFHDTCNITLDILPEFIQFVKAEGYEITRLDKMCNLQAYA